MKLQKISEITATLPFTEFDFLQKYREGFKLSELGRIREQLPLKEMSEEIRRHMPRRNPQGNKPMFPPEGEIALMFLKPYTGLSDDGLVEMLNGSLYMQMFCGVLIDPANPIRNGKIVSAIRNRMAPYLDIKGMQKILYGKWSPYMADKDMFLTDATCYESHLRYPTDIKLLWECCGWMYALLKEKSRLMGERMPRTKYHDVDKARLVYAKQRKPRKSETVKLQRRLLHLLEKLLKEWDRLNKVTGGLILLNAGQNRRLMACRQVLDQQRRHFRREEVKHRIVSIDRPYIHPILRGKENKRVEFGAKVNCIQINGISFIEHHSFDAFNEGVRLNACIEYHKELTGLDAKRVGADSIYATNNNRRHCTENNITTCFVRKGPVPKDEQADVRTARRIIGNLRATVMEGSFGNQKEHYGLARIAARNRNSETLQLFFGIHMANAATLAARHIADKIRKKKTA
ncbi:MAG: transposase [Muribaculaceae bacterium]|nr:transposase [Muribaculaceae bacterium]